MFSDVIVWLGLLFSAVLLLTGCDLFNLSVPKYIDEYTNNAAAEQLEEIHAAGLPDPVILRDNNRIILLPSLDTTLSIRLRNPRGYDLKPQLYEWLNNDWVKLTGTSIYINGVSVETETSAGSDIVRIHLGQTNYGHMFRMKLTLIVNDETQREFLNYPYDIPVIKYNDYPKTPSIVEVTPTGTGTGLTISWNLVDDNDCRGATRFVVSCNGVSETYTRGRTGSVWDNWSGPGIVDEVPLGSGNYKVTAFSSMETTVNAAYTVALAVINEDGLQRNTDNRSQAEGNYIYVVPGGSGSRTGFSWGHALGDVQEAINYAAANGKTHVLIKAGTYYPTSWPNKAFDSNIDDTNPRHKHFSLRNGVTVIGGFAGTETGIIPGGNASQTVLSGDLNKNEIRDDNDALHVFHHPYGLNLTNTAKLQNVTVTGGYASDNSVNNGSNGGGMVNISCDPSINSCIFTGNASAANGGGIFNFASSPVVTDCKFENNESITNGGGMYNASSSNAKLTNCEFSGNISNGAGGGLSSSGSNAILTNCTFTGNDSIGSYGGGIYVTAGTCTMTGGTISGNSASDEGGGIFVGPNGTYRITGGTITGNMIGTDITEKGAGICLYTATSILSIGGGAMINSNNDVFFYNSSAKINIVENFADSVPMESILVTPDNYATTPQRTIITASPPTLLTPANIARFHIRQETSGTNRWAIDSAGKLVMAIASRESGITRYYGALGIAALCAAGSSTNPDVITLRSALITQNETVTVPGGKYIHVLPPAGTSGTNYIIKRTVTDLKAMFSVETGAGLTFGPAGSSGTYGNIIIDGGKNEGMEMWDRGMIKCSGNLTLNYNVTIQSSKHSTSSSNGSGIALVSGALVMNGNSVVCSNDTLQAGAGVYVDGQSTFIMNDNASIYNNTSGGYGGGVATFGTFAMGDNAIIRDNTAVDHGGGVAVDGGTFTMSGNSLVKPDNSNTVSLSRYGGLITISGILTQTIAANIVQGTNFVGFRVLAGNVSENYQKFLYYGNADKIDSNGSIIIVIGP